MPLSDADAALLTPPPSVPGAATDPAGSGAVLVADEAIDPSDTVTQAEIDRSKAKTEANEANVLAEILKKSGKPDKNDRIAALDGDDDLPGDEPTETPAAKPGKEPKTPAEPSDSEEDRLAFMRAQFTPQEAADYRAKYGDKAFVAKAAALRKQQADVDRAYAQLRGQKPPTSSATAPGAEASGAALVAPTKADAGHTPEEIDELLSDSLDEVAATKIRAYQNGTSQQLQLAQQAELAAKQKLVATLFKASRTTLSAELPGYSDPAKEPKIREMMKVLDPNLEALESPEMFDQYAKQAYFAAFGSHIAAEVKSKLIADNKAVRNGQLTAGQRNSSKSPGNQDDFEGDILKVVKRFKDSPLLAEKTAAVKKFYGKD